MGRTSATFHGNYYNAEDEAITAELRSSHVAIDLVAFEALPAEVKAARWRQFDAAAKHQLVALKLTALFGDWDADAVEYHIAKLDAKWGAAEISDLAIPSAEQIADAAQEAGDLAWRHGDRATGGQFDRVRMNVLSGARLRWHAGDLLISSVNNPGAVYVVNRRGCSCPAGQKGKQTCWHIGLLELLIDIQQTAAESADIDADAAAERQLRDRITAVRARYLEAA